MRIITRSVVALSGLVFLSLNSLAPALARTTTAPADTDSNRSTITESHGNIFKRGFIDWKKDAWADPEPAQVGDTLSEGMQLGTKENSWAQVRWPNVVARAWENSLFAVAPNKRLVYLSSGEMLFRLDKHRKNKDNYYIWTKTLQARIHGTTVLVQAHPDYSRITVLEGDIVLLNRINHSVVTLKPGVVFQVNANTGKGFYVSLNKATSKIQFPGSTNSADLTKISKQQSQVELFRTDFETSSVSQADGEQLLSHPLVSGKFDNELDSLPLIKNAMSSLSKHFDKDNSAMGRIRSEFQIVTPPTSTRYEVGSSAIRELPFPPGALKEFPPSGVMPAQGSGLVAETQKNYFNGPAGQKTTALASQSNATQQRNLQSSGAENLAISSGTFAQKISSGTADFSNGTSARDDAKFSASATAHGEVLRSAQSAEAGYKLSNIIASEQSIPTKTYVGSVSATDFSNVGSTLSNITTANFGNIAATSLNNVASANLSTLGGTNYVASNINNTGINTNGPSSFVTQRTNTSFYTTQNNNYSQNNYGNLNSGNGQNNYGNSGNWNNGYGQSNYGNNWNSGYGQGNYGGNWNNNGGRGYR